MNTEKPNESMNTEKPNERNNLGKIWKPNFGLEEYKIEFKKQFPDLANRIEIEDEVHFITGMLAESARNAIFTNDPEKLRRILFFVDEIITRNKIENIDSEIINSFQISFVTKNEIENSECGESLLNEISGDLKSIIEIAI